MKFAFEASCVLELEHNEGTNQTKHIATKFNLGVSRNLDLSKYIDKNDLPTADGCDALTHVLVQSLIGNIHNAHQRGYIDSAKHLRRIISELERGFIAQGNIGESTF